MIDKTMLIADIIAKDEAIGAILAGAGMGCVGCAMAHGENLEQACATHGVDADALVAAINEYLENKEN